VRQQPPLHAFRFPSLTETKKGSLFSLLSPYIQNPLLARMFTCLSASPAYESPAFLFP